MSPRLASLARQNLLLEFASLKNTCPDGVYVSITPGDSSLWSGILSVRKGPYAPAILRFQLSFPSPFPATSPLITFSSDIFHPLLTPLTTYTFTNSTSDVDTVSATDDERLPPGGFSLRHGFPQWFGRTKDKTSGPTPSSESEANSVMSESSTTLSTPTMYEVLDYLRSAFTDESFLDSVPLEAAANSGAYHAWTTHRMRETGAGGTESQSHTEDGQRSLPTSPTSETPIAGRTRRPGEWNWEGVWEERVRRGVQNSLSEPVLFGAAVGGDDIIRFFDLEPDRLEKIKQQMV